jgi:dolichyldiphosphatase
VLCAKMDLHDFKPFTSTFVVYRGGDRLGFLLAGASLAPVFVIVAYATLLASRRDLATAAALAGQLLNEVANAVLKRVLAQERPAHALSAYSPRYGMPSNHAQFMGYLAAYMCLWSLLRWGVAARWRWASAACWVAAAVLVAWSRVYLSYHTPSQVAAGLAIGAAAGLTWRWVVDAFLRPAFPAVQQWWVCRALLVRDCSACPNVLQAEYDATRAARPGDATRAARPGAATPEGSDKQQ